MRQDAAPHRVGWTFVGDIDETGIVIPKRPKVNVFEDCRNVSLPSPGDSSRSCAYLGEIMEVIDTYQNEKPMNVDEDEEKDDFEVQCNHDGRRESAESAPIYFFHSDKEHQNVESKNEESKALELKRPKRLSTTGVNFHKASQIDDDNTNDSNPSRWKFPRNSIHLVRLRHSFGWSIRSRIRSKNQRKEVWLEAPTATYSPSNDSISNQDSKEENERGGSSVVEQDELVASTCHDSPSNLMQEEITSTRGGIEQSWW